MLLRCGRIYQITITMNAITISELNCYPIKSCRGIPLEAAQIGPRGIQYDREWMFVNEDNTFVAQRGNPAIGTVGVPSLCLIQISISEHHLILSAPDMPTLLVQREEFGSIETVRVWDSVCSARYQGNKAAAWATEYISREVPGRYKLVRMAHEETRASTTGIGQVAFSDGYPLLVISQASLDDLNSKMPDPVPMNRFRPNIVISGCDAYDEDTMSDFRIGDVQFIGMNRCTRCVLTTIDQETGIKGKEPLSTLAKHRRSPDGVVFGRNFNHNGIGTISVGDTLIF